MNKHDIRRIGGNEKKNSRIYRKKLVELVLFLYFYLQFDINRVTLANMIIVGLWVVLIFSITLLSEIFVSFSVKSRREGLILFNLKFC